MCISKSVLRAFVGMQTWKITVDEKEYTLRRAW
jgi:hypothetical protein